MQLFCSTTSLRKCVLHFLIFISIAIALLIYGTEMQQKLFDQIPCVINRCYFNGDRREPVILAWTMFFGQKLDYLLRDALSDCPFNCEIRKRSSYNSQDENADAIVFHLRDLNVSDLPKQRRPEQHFVSLLQESPIHAGRELQEIPRDYFNTTLGYQLVPGSYAWTYGAFYPINDTNRSSLRNWTTVTDQQIDVALKKKKAIAYALISNCKTNSKRETYIKALGNHMKLTLRGDCYEKKSKKRIKKKCNMACEQNLTQSHFFYLAFENSVCNGYVTEKFFRIAHLIIPVVLRRAVLKGIAPENSFVAADDFATPKQLANFLLSVSANTTRYLEFFDWTKHFYRDMPENNRGVCDLCRDLYYRNVSSPWRRSGSPNIQEYYSTKQCEEGVGEKLTQRQKQ